MEKMFKTKEAKFSSIELDELYNKWCEDTVAYTDERYIVEKFIEWLRRQ